MKHYQKHMLRLLFNCIYEIYGSSADTAGTGPFRLILVSCWHWPLLSYWHSLIQTPAPADTDPFRLPTPAPLGFWHSLLQTPAPLGFWHSLLQTPAPLGFWYSFLLTPAPLGGSSTITGCWCIAPTAIMSHRLQWVTGRNGLYPVRASIYLHDTILRKQTHSLSSLPHGSCQ